MKISTKEKIILATLDLAADYGLKSLSMSQIAEKVGIKKPSLYNHFDSKETLIKEMYVYLRAKSKENLAESFTSDDLYESVMNYKKMVTSRDMLRFYKVIYAERTTNKDAAEIIIAETNKMIDATKLLFRKLGAKDADIAATSFAMTIHGLIDYELDCEMAGKKYDKTAIEEYIKWFLKSQKEENER